MHSNFSVVIVRPFPHTPPSEEQVQQFAKFYVEHQMQLNGSNGCCKPYCLCRACRERRMAERLRKMRKCNGSCMPPPMCTPPMSKPCCDCGMPDFDIPCSGMTNRMPNSLPGCSTVNQPACCCLGGPAATQQPMGLGLAGPSPGLGRAAGGPLTSYPAAAIPGLAGIANLTPDGRLEANPITGYPVAATQGALAMPGYAAAGPQALSGIPGYAAAGPQALSPIPGYAAAGPQALSAIPGLAAAGNRVPLGLGGPSAIPGYPDGTVVAPDGRLISPAVLNQLSAAGLSGPAAKGIPGVTAGAPFLQTSGHYMQASGRFMQEEVTTLGIFGLAGIPGMAAGVPAIGKPAAIGKGKKTKGFEFVSFFTEAVAVLAFFIIATITFWMTVVYYAYKLAVKLYYSDRSVQIATFLVIGLLVISTICSIPYGSQPKHLKRRNVMKVEVKTYPPAPASASTELQIRSIEQVATCPRADGFFMRYFGWMFFWRSDAQICETSRTFFDLRLRRPACPPGKKTFFCRHFRWLPFVNKDGPEESSFVSRYTSWVTSPWKKEAKKEPYAIFTYFSREPQQTSKIRSLFSWLPFIGRKEPKSQPYAIVAYISPKNYFGAKEEKGYFSWKTKKSKKKKKRSSWWPFSREPEKKSYAIVTYFTEPKYKKTSSSWLPFRKGREKKPYTIVSYFKEPKSKKKSSSSSWLSFRKEPEKKPYAVVSYFTSSKQPQKEPYAIAKYFSGTKEKSKKKDKKKKEQRGFSGFFGTTKSPKDSYSVLGHYMSLKRKPAKQPYAIVAYFTSSKGRKKEPYAIVAYFTPKKKSKKQPYPITAYFTSKKELTRKEMQKTSNSFVRYFSRQEECNFWCRYFGWLPFTSKKKKSKKNEPYAIVSYFTAKKKSRSSSSFDMSFFKAKPKRSSFFSLPFGRSKRSSRKSIRRSQCDFFCAYFNWLPPHLRDEYDCRRAKMFCIFGPKAVCSKKRKYLNWMPSMSMQQSGRSSAHRSYYSQVQNSISFGRKPNCCGAYSRPHQCNLVCKYFSWLPFYPKVRVKNITLTVTDDTAREVYKQSKLYAIPMELKQPPAVLVYMRDAMFGA